MKILLDECVPFALLDYLKSKKFDVDHVTKTAWAGLSNSELYNRAQPDYQIFITTDRHFAHPEKFKPIPTMGVIYLRVAPTTGPRLVEAIQGFLQNVELNSVIGKLVTVRRNDFTIR